MKLFVDDLRDPPDNSWITARNSKDAIDCLAAGVVSDLSLDHDLGGFDTGYEVVAWIENQLGCGKSIRVPRIVCHSANPVGRQRIEQAIKSVEKMSLKVTP